MGLSRNILKMNKFGQVEPFTFVLSTKNYKHLGKLNNVKTDTIDFKANLNSANEISFEVYKKVNGEIESLWDDIIDLKSIYVPELDEYFEINVVYNDKLDELKIITGTSLCEAELSQTIIRGTEINTETDIDRTDYKQTTFYNEVDPKASLLNRVLSFAPHYSIGYVDPSLHNIQRSFSIDGTSIYDFLVGECSEQFNCIFVFDSTNRTINAYDLYTTCYECGHRDAYNFVCPECGSDNVNYFGQDTTIFVNKENLSDDIKLETDVGSIKNCFRLRAGDEDMTADVVSVNPNGTAYIYYITPEQRADMSVELVNKIDSYDELVEQYTPEYQELTQDIRDLEDEITYYQHVMMPAPIKDDEEVPEDSISKTQIKNLTEENLSPLGMEKLLPVMTKDTIDSVVKNYARVFVKTSLVKIDVAESSFWYRGKDDDGWNYGTWVGKLKLTAYSDPNDIAITDTLTLTINDNYGDFLKQKVMKDMALNDEEGSIFDLFKLASSTKPSTEETYTSYYIQCLSSSYKHGSQANTYIGDLYDSEFKINKKLAGVFSQTDNKCEIRLYMYDSSKIYLDGQYNNFAYVQDYANVILERDGYYKYGNYSIVDGEAVWSYVNQEGYHRNFGALFSWCTKNIEDSGYLRTNIPIFNSREECLEYISNPSTEDIDAFKEALKKYCLSRLQSFRLSLDTAITTLMSLDQASEEADWYKDIYVPYYNKLVACDEEIIVREATIAELNEQLTPLKARKSEIQKMLNFEDYLGKELYLEFCTYRREDEYHNENYISDGLSSAEKIDKAKEFLEVAKKELIRSATGQHTISSNMYNIMLMDEFKPLVDKFALGNFIRIQAGDELYRLRLNSYNITFSDLSIINTEFSDMTKDVNVVAATQKILSDAQSMASNFSYISKQAEKGKEANDSVNNIVEEGLNSALMQIKNNVNEEAVIDNNGYLGRALDDITGKYYPEQVRLTHNILAFTDDNWAHTSCALGKHKYKYYDPESGTLKDDIGYGLSAKFVQAGHIYGSKMISGDIYSENYSSTSGTHIDLNEGTFSFAGGNLKYDGSELSVDGKITAKSGEIGGISVGTSGLYYSGTASTDGFGIWKNGYHSHNSSYIIMHAGANGSNISTAKFRLYQNGTLYASNVELEGKITAKSGSISGNLELGGSLINTTGNYTVTLRGVQSDPTYGVFYITDKSSGSNSYPFIVKGNGSFVATKATITGTITTNALTATGGEIGGFTINANSVTSGSWGEAGSVMMCTGTGTKKSIGGSASTVDGWCFTAGSKFGVTKNGVLYANDVHVKGEITATSGTIDTVTATNLTVNSGTIKLGDATLNSNGLTVGSTGGKSTIGNFKVDSNSLYMGTWSAPNTPDIFIASSSSSKNYKICGVTANNWAIGAGGNFGVTLDGAMYCKKGKVGGLDVDEDGSLRGTNIRIYPENGYTPTGSSRKFYIVIFSSGKPVGGIDADGWHSISV